jgi:hypothetical protein
MDNIALWEINAPKLTIKSNNYIEQINTRPNSALFTLIIATIVNMDLIVHSLMLKMT